MTTAATKAPRASRARSIAFCGLTVALMAVAAWITVPIGPVPFTLQIFVMVFALVALKPKQCLASIGCYLLLGAVGVPVFSSMRGGIGVILGTTGGFLWGYIVGAAIALVLMGVLKKALGKGDVPAAGSVADIVVSVIGALVFLAVVYVCGWTQLMLVANMSPAAAFAAAVAPFVVVDLIKTAVGIAVAVAVKRAVR